jgi:hypothetical protein
MQNAIQLSKIRSMIIGSLSVVALTLLFSCSKNIAEIPGQEEVSASNQSSGAQIQNSIELAPYASTLFIPCANGGAGEDVTLTGTIKIVRQEMYNNQRFTFILHAVPQGVTGVGLSTGDNFTAIGGSQETVTGTIEYGGQYSATYIQQMRFTGQGISFIVKYKFHVTVTSNGEISTRIDEEKIECNN